MGFLNKLLGYRWSLYIVQNDRELIYAMHHDSVNMMIGYVELYFSDGAEPVEPWSLYLNFNHTHKTIKLNAHHFANDMPTPDLFQAIEAIDPDWGDEKFKGSEPIFEEAANKRRLKISEHKMGHIDLQAMIDNVGKPRETTFFSVMDMVFGQS